MAVSGQCRTSNLERIYFDSVKLLITGAAFALNWRNNNAVQQLNYVMRYTSARYNILGKTEHLKFVFFVFFKQTLKKAIKYFEGRIHIKCPIPAN
jgi:hypothetical protein